jgi:hypothetical protein
MWFLRRVLNNNLAAGNASPTTGLEIYLRQGTHVVGRQKSKCSIVLPDDPELSRQHATIRVRYNGGDGHGSVYLRDGVSVEKPSSSSGTFLNSEKVRVNWSSGDMWQPVHAGDRLIFGRQYTFELCLLEKKLQFVTSRVGKEEIAKVRQQITALGATHSKVWENSKTDCLVMGSFSSTFKAVSAIAFGKPIIAVKWFDRVSIIGEHRNPFTLLESCEDSDLPPNFARRKDEQTTSRALLFAAKTFLSLSPPAPANLDYLTLAEQCGAKILRCYNGIDPLPTPLSSTTARKLLLLVSHQSEGGNALTEETCRKIQELKSSGVRTISKEEVARVIINNKYSPDPENVQEEPKPTAAQKKRKERSVPAPESMHLPEPVEVEKELDEAPPRKRVSVDGWIKGSAVAAAMGTPHSDSTTEGNETESKIVNVNIDANDQRNNKKSFRKCPVRIAKRTIPYENMYANEQEMSDKARQMRTEFQELDDRERQADLQFVING